MKKLRDEQRNAFNARLAAALLAAKKRPESPEKEPDSILEIENKTIDDEKLDQFSADWVQKQMSEAEWQKLSEQERQRLIAIAKLEQKKLQKEMYGDDYLKAMKSLEGDEEALKKLQDDQRKEFDARLAAALLAAKKRPKSPAKEPESLLEIEDKALGDEKIEQFSADWVQQQMSETEWKQLSEQERQRLIAVAKLEQKKLQKEIYGDDYLKAMKTLEGDEEATKKLQEEQRRQFNARLAAALAAAKKPKVEKLDEIQEIAEQELPPEKVEQFCADWVKEEMDAAEWKKLSEQERQKLIALARLEQKKLQKEIYGDDFTAKLKQLEGDEAAILALREEQRTKFNVLLATRVLKQEKPILIQVLDEKIKIVAQFGDEYKNQVSAQVEIVKNLDENDDGVLFAATLNLLQVALANDGPETSAIDQIPVQGPNRENLKLVARPKDESKITSIEQYKTFKGWEKLHPYFAKNTELLNVFTLALQEAQFVFEDEKVKLGAQEFANYPKFWLKCRLYQIFHQFEEGKDDRFVKRSLREVLALKTVIDEDLSLEKFQLMLGQFFYRNLESIKSIDKVIEGKNLRFMLGALLLDFNELFSNSQEKQNLRNRVTEKYSSIRDRALMVIARGDPSVGLRPVSEAKIECDKMKKELEATHHERKAVMKYMKARGFMFSSPPEKAFGPNLARAYDTVLTATIVIKDDEIVPESDLNDAYDLYYVLYQYEQMEIAFHIFHESKNSPINEECLWQKNEKERLDLTSEFIEAVHTSQLSARCRQRAILNGKEIKQDRQRYIQLARLGLAQKESRKVLKDQNAPKDSNSPGWLSFGDNIILRMLQNGKNIVIRILNDSFQEELRDFCMLMPESERAQEIVKTNVERAKIDPNHASAKIDNNSLLQKGLALVYANKMHLAIKLGANEMNSSDICAAILAELLEEFDNFRETEWKVHSKATALELEKRLNREIEAGTSDEVWKLITGKTSVARAEVDEEHDQIVDKKRDDVIAAALLKTVGQQEWQRLGEKERQMKILEMKKLQRQNEKESVGFSTKKLLEDFNGNEEAYRKYKEEEKAKSNSALDAKIAALKAKKAEETDKKKQKEVEEEIQKLTTLKRSLSDLQKVELDADKEKLAIMEFLESSDGQMSQEKMRQMAALKIRMQKKQLANGEIEDTALWIRSTEDKSAAGAAAEKARQKELAKSRLAALKAGKVQKSEAAENASKEDQLATLLQNIQNEEMTFVYSRIESNKYKSLGSDRIELLSKLDSTENVEDAVDIRLALIAVSNREPDLEIIRLLAEEQKKVSYEELNKDSRGDFEDLLEDVKMKSVRNVAFGVGSDEEVERELASKYRAVKRQASRNAIKEEISDAVWEELDEKEQVCSAIKI
ncbi:unnamed protein product [Oikopleura dioica]|uniref:Uncharacterized protein n=1 Tax=Oikopleura dioica TaxID=34765 RepID=E4XSU4_OIKDI|nr:unnamed protein product [Oikopleura dioica]